MHSDMYVKYHVPPLLPCVLNYHTATCTHHIFVMQYTTVVHAGPALHNVTQIQQ